MPVAIIGTEDSVSQMLKFKKPHITAEFGPVIPTPKLDRNNRDGQLQDLTDEIMCRIAVMMPEKYHGFYKDHPRLKELLKEKRS